MDINLPVSAGEAFWGLLGFCLLGWNLFLNSQRKVWDETVSDVAALKRDAWTRADHKEFREEVNHAIDKMGDTLTKAIDKLGDRLDKIVQDRGV